MKLRIFLAVLAYISISFVSYAQVAISPTMVMIDENQRFASYLVLNGSDQPQEISVEFVFGYPDVVSNTMRTVYDRPEKEKLYSIADNVQAFPRKFTLAPQQRQVVRITVRPNRELDDGVYWSRIKTTSNPQSPAIGSKLDEEVSANINIQFEQVTTLIYKKGNLSTGLDIEEFKTTKTDSSLIITTRIKRTGNAPYLGNLTLTVYDEQDNTVLSDRTNIAVYFDYISRVSANLKNFDPGTYTVEATFVTDRTDIPTEEIVQTAPISRTITFDIQ